MKAVIMAGGEGSRLRPLTCDRPKPMVPVLDRPMMSYIIELLQNHGVKEMCATLQYMPEVIRDYFSDGAEYGVRMQYSIEQDPLGTAGSVKNARGFIRDTFMVISGDALTDFDLSRAFEFHRKKSAAATLVLARVSNPLEYGVVIADKEGRIARFLEKPSWGEVFSDTVNTGIYILEPDVLEYIPDGRMFDFSKDLFPLLMRKGKPVYGIVLDGYWCDIGNLQQYIQAHMDVLSGRVNIKTGARMTIDGVYLGDGAEVSPGAVIKGPAFVGSHCLVQDGARIEEYSVLGSHCVLGDRATVKKSVVWDGCRVGNGSELRGTVLCSRVQVGKGVRLYEGSVAGSGAVIGENATVMPDVKVWPGKEVDKETVVHSSLIWGKGVSKKIFGSEGITGACNAQIVPEYAARLSAAFAFTMGRQARLAVSTDGTPASAMVGLAASSGILSTGAGVVDLGDISTPLHRFAVREMLLDGGVHIKTRPDEGDYINMVFTGRTGANLDRGQERKVENAFAREDFNRCSVDSIQQVRAENILDKYIKSASEILEGLCAKGSRLVISCNRELMDQVVKPVLEKAGLGVIAVDPVIRGSDDNVLRLIFNMVRDCRAAGGAVIDSEGDRLAIVDERGRQVKDHKMTALLVLVLMKNGSDRVVVPVNAPGAIEQIAGRYRGSVLRSKTSACDFARQIIIGDRSGIGRFSQFQLFFDPVAALAGILNCALAGGGTLSRLVDELPEFHMTEKTVFVPWEEKGRIMRQIIEDFPGEKEMLDGIKVFHREGWALVLPDPEDPACRIYSEGASMEIADSLADFYEDAIKRYQGKGQANLVK